MVVERPSATFSWELYRELQRQRQEQGLASSPRQTGGRQPRGSTLPGPDRLSPSMQGSIPTYACALSETRLSLPNNSPQGRPLATHKLAHSQAALLMVVGRSSSQAGAGSGGPAGASGGNSCSRCSGANPAGGDGGRRNPVRWAHCAARMACRQPRGGKEGGHLEPRERLALVQQQANNCYMRTARKSCRDRAGAERCCCC